MDYNQPDQERGGMQESAVGTQVRTRRRVGRTPVVTYTIIAITIGVFLLQMLSEVMLGVDLPLVYGAKINESILSGEIWRLLTPALLHASLLHIGFNMYFLFIIGSGLERFYGPARFLVLYIVSAFAGNVLSFLLSDRASVGASTALFGLLAAEAVLLIQNKDLFPNFRAAIQNIVLTLVVNLFLGLTMAQVDNFGHLGGLLGGFALAWLGGPKFEVNSLMGSYQVKDQRGMDAMLLSAGVVSAVFAGMAAVKFFAGL